MLFLLLVYYFTSRSGKFRSNVDVAIASKGMQNSVQLVYLAPTRCHQQHLPWQEASGFVYTFERPHYLIFFYWNEEIRVKVPIPPNHLNYVKTWRMEDASPISSTSLMSHDLLAVIRWKQDFFYNIHLPYYREIRNSWIQLFEDFFKKYTKIYTLIYRKIHVLCSFPNIYILSFNGENFFMLNKKNSCRCSSHRLFLPEYWRGHNLLFDTFLVKCVFFNHTITRLLEITLPALVQEFLLDTFDREYWYIKLESKVLYVEYILHYIFEFIKTLKLIQFSFFCNRNLEFIWSDKIVSFFSAIVHV